MARKTEEAPTVLHEILLKETALEIKVQALMEFLSEHSHEARRAFICAVKNVDLQAMNTHRVYGITAREFVALVQKQGDSSSKEPFTAVRERFCINVLENDLQELKDWEFTSEKRCENTFKLLQFREAELQNISDESRIAAKYFLLFQDKKTIFDFFQLERRGHGSLKDIPTAAYCLQKVYAPAVRSR